ncbi:SDR family oxidoreductase [Telluribacter sp.]|jgi:NAD(P)H dehydrogenase (quinone)|uniref:SDR family oxidoreductase n=1 Tax=Telluribacter sp. TaxID=1978767 RepID=UPI002E16641A|nr:SDR family oxidoreductase [Telluribacter sp.]
MRIAITGATGQLGQLIVNKLKEKVSGDNIVALARSIHKASNPDVEAREADYDKPETLTSALAGIDTLLLISSGGETGRRVAQHRNVIEAAKLAGVKWIVYTSVLHADTSTLGLAEDHRTTEADLKNAGIPVTLLRNGWYTENYTGTIPGAIAGGAFIGSAGAGKISSAARADYADAAVAVLTSQGHQGKIYELAGDDAWTLGDLAAEISRQTGKNIPYVNMPEADYAATLVSFGLPDGFAHAIAGWDAAAAGGALYDDSHQLSTLIGRPTTSLAVTITEALQATST